MMELLYKNVPSQISERVLKVAEEVKEVEKQPFPDVFQNRPSGLQHY